MTIHATLNAHDRMQRKRLFDLAAAVRKVMRVMGVCRLFCLTMPLVVLASCGGGGGGGGSTGGGTAGGGATTTWTISGTISPSSLAAGATVTLSGASTATTTTNGSGAYSFSGLANGAYTVTASGTALTFSPASAPVSISGSNATVNFTAAAAGGPSTPATYSISGKITGAAGVVVQSLQVTLTNATTSMTAATTTTDTSGNFSFAGLANGPYLVMPSDTSLNFSPTDRLVTLSGSNAIGVDFTAATPPPPPPTQTAWAISGAVSPLPLGGGLSVTLGGASSATTVTNSSGVFNFTNLVNGAYTVTPSSSTSSGAILNINPGIRAVTLNGANETSANFTASLATYSVSGSITPSSLGANVQVLLSSSTMAAVTVTTNASGDFTFPNVVNGAYTVAPSSSSLNFSPGNKSVTVNNAAQTGVNFTASTPPPPPPSTYSISGTITSGAGVQVALSGVSSATTNANSSGFYSFTGLANGSYTVTPSSSSLNINPASRTVAISNANLTNVNFTASTPTYSISGAITSSPSSLGAGVQVTLSGPVSATTTTNTSGGFTFSGVGNGTYTVTPSGSSLNFNPLSQSVTVTNGNVTNVTFAASTPPPVTYTISGTVTPSPLSTGATVTLSGPSTATTTVNSSGAFSFSGLANGTYTLTPSGTSLTFNPVSRSVAVNNANVTGVTFAASTTPPPTYTISGTVTPSPLSTGATVTLSGPSTATTTVNSSGAFSFSGLANGTYTLTPSGTSLTFNPVSRSVAVNNANVTGVTFAASTTPPPTYTISGTVTPSSLSTGSTVTLSGTSTASTTVNSSGAYSFSGLANGSYTVTPSGTSLTFNPTSRSVTIASGNVSSIDFTASTSSNVFFFDDFTGSTLGSAWTALDRSGPGSQDENLCNKPSAVTVSGGNLVITTSATPATCGDAVSAPRQYPYTSGSIQWTSLNFTYGTVEIRAKFPPQNTGTWPALWLLGSNCQAANIVNGSEAVPFMGCPAQGEAAYREIDMVECDTRSWCHLVLAQGTFGWGMFCDFPVDANWHVFSLNWTASILTLSVDGAQVCSKANNSIKGPAFLIMQTQTTSATGVGGLPNNARLPTTFEVDYVRVTQ